VTRYCGRIRLKYLKYDVKEVFYDDAEMMEVREQDLGVALFIVGKWRPRGRLLFLEVNKGKNGKIFFSIFPYFSHFFPFFPIFPIFSNFPKFSQIFPNFPNSFPIFSNE
jgi:hypothetical protein